MPTMPGVQGRASDHVFHWGSADATPPPPPSPPLPPLPGGGTVDAKLHELVKFVAAIEQDPLNSNSFFRALERRALKPGTGGPGQPRAAYHPVTLKMVEELAADRACFNALQSRLFLGLKMWVFVVGFAQSGKTNSQMFTLWSNGVLAGFPGVHYSYSRSKEGRRMAASARTFNRLVVRCAELMQLQSHGVEYKLLDFHDSEDVKGPKHFIESVKTMTTSNKIPVLTFMGNGTRVKNSIEIIEEMSLYVGRDQPDIVGPDGYTTNEGAMRALLVVDEAELFLQPVRTTTTKKTNDAGQAQPPTTTMTYGRLCRSMNPGVFADEDEGSFRPIRLKNRVDDPNAPPGRAPAYDLVLKDTVFDCFTSVVNYTATPQAFAVSSNSGRGKTVDAVLCQPSKNYWAYVQKPGWGCKTIDHKVCVDWKVMARDMMETVDAERHGLVVISSSKHGTSSIAGQKKLAQEAATNNPGLLAMGWEGAKVSIYTSDLYWVEKFEATTSFVDPGNGVGNAINGDQVYRFESKTGNNKFEEWNDVTETVDKKHISSYMGVMSFIAETLNAANSMDIPATGETGEQLDRRNTPLVVVPKTLLFAMNMVGRCTPVKAYGHEFPLSDMFAGFGKGWHDECVQQILGRLNGVDKRTREEGKTIWASDADLEFLYMGIVEVPFFVKNIGSGKSIKEIYEDAWEELASCNEGIYDPELDDGKHGVKHILRLRLSGRSRLRQGPNSETSAAFSRKRFTMDAYRRGLAVPSSPVQIDMPAPVVSPEDKITALAASKDLASSTAAAAAAVASTTPVVTPPGSPAGPDATSDVGVDLNTAQESQGMFKALLKTNNKSFSASACDPQWRKFLLCCAQDDRFPVEMHGSAGARTDAQACIVIKGGGDDENVISVKVKGSKEAILANYNGLCPGVSDFGSGSWGI